MPSVVEEPCIPCKASGSGRIFLPPMINFAITWSAPTLLNFITPPPKWPSPLAATYNLPFRCPHRSRHKSAKAEAQLALYFLYTCPVFEAFAGESKPKNEDRRLVRYEFLRNSPEIDTIVTISEPDRNFPHGPLIAKLQITFLLD